MKVQSLPEQWYPCQRRDEFVFVEKRKCYRSRRDLAFEVLGVAIRHPDRDFREFRDTFSQKVARQSWREEGYDAEADGTFGLAVLGANDTRQLVELMQECGGFLVKDFTCRSRQDAPGTSLQQRNAQQ